MPQNLQEVVWHIKSPFSQAMPNSKSAILWLAVISRSSMVFNCFNSCKYITAKTWPKPGSWATCIHPRCCGSSSSFGMCLCHITRSCTITTWRSTPPPIPPAPSTSLKDLHPAEHHLGLSQTMMTLRKILKPLVSGSQIAAIRCWAYQDTTWYHHFQPGLKHWAVLLRRPIKSRQGSITSLREPPVIESRLSRPTLFWAWVKTLVPSEPQNSW